MTLRIKVTRTHSVIYSPTDQDGAWYDENDIVNIHQAALLDVKSLEDGDFELTDIDAVDEDDDWKVVLVEQDSDGLNIRELDVQENNTDRDEFFPDDDEDEDEDEDDDELDAGPNVAEKPVAGELNAGGEAYPRF